ncbi:MULTISPECIES: ATP-dependent acyl-CoA ligase [unclassified Pseudomonas]|uniref:ATP-dependent acyl-CoA ligase n=1 Tax=unclassified Pseudomonas TaxID=196821 RepID=UPI00048507EE|nr:MULTISPECIES: ATP-dependent acyl-CoA ligase [unclassified Pseudomonas]PXX64553.1 crotonobetaine/carnitine-CoA ligase [Pseudomonas sp. LAIL14HWK12:I1]SMD12241.1 crotonobetaine/carnitine-CoA ligase [Pseudomonas sp. URIL14HWK12:I5]SOC98429.1 crotonobetaine/carnitine-CoA ligase [Pseudomonas sp. LAIL14HWK12:I3]
MDESFSEQQAVGGALTLPALLSKRIERSPDTALFSDRSCTWTAVELVEVIAARAATLAEYGIQRGDRVGLMCANRAEFLEVLLACGWLGAVAVPINTACRGMQLSHILANSGARLLVCDDANLDVLAALDYTSLAVETVWVVSPQSEPNAMWQDRIQVQSMPPRSTSKAPSAVLEDGDPLVILYTSGTSGLSKGVICPHAQFFWWGVNTGGDLQVRPGDVLYTCLPLFHTNALNAFFQALLHDAQLVVDKRFSASGFYPALAETGATVTYLLGAMVPILLSRPQSEQERAHSVRVALAPGVPEQFHAPFIQRSGIGLIDGYGATETNAVIGGPLATQRPGCMGRLAKGFTALVVDSQDRPVPDGEPGELVLRAEHPFAFACGYFGMPDKTVEAWRNLWYHTGDRVVRDSDGYFRFVDRLKDTIRRRGENISSFEVEQVLLSHPAVELAAVYAVKSELAEDEVMAAIIIKEGARLDPLELTQYCESRLAYFAVPRYLDFVIELPKTENGKVQKYKLRALGVTATTWDLECSGYRLKRA